MKKLLYKGVEFDDFQLYNGEPERYGDCQSESIDEFEGVDVYVCPSCVKKYGLYAECNTTEEKVNAEIDVDVECNYYDMTCGVKGCYNRNCYDGYFSTEGCQLVENTDDTNPYVNSNFIDDVEKMRDFKILSKEEFLASYSYLTEAEYENTARLFEQKRKTKAKTSDNIVAKRVLQVSFDIVVGHECDGTELAEQVADELERRGYRVFGAGFQADVTEYYKGYEVIDNG